MTKKKIIVIAAIAVAVLAAGTGAYLVLRKSSVVPGKIQKQVSFPIFYPEHSQAIVDANTFQYDASIKSVSFMVSYMGKKITFAEQSAPESFADDPNFYPKFVEKLNNYLTFDSVNGRVDITRPSKVASQTGIMSAKGTLLFAKSDGDLQEDGWKKLFNSISYTKPN